MVTEGRTTSRRMTAHQVVEVTIGLWDSSKSPRGQNPPLLATAILDALRAAGYSVSSNRCTLCGRGTEQPSVCLVCQEVARHA